MPKVSVIIPTYNCSNWLLEAIDSVLSQSFKDYELIIVDDGSTDDTQDVVKAVKDERIRYFYKENGGAASTRNFGIAKARDDFVAFLDADDLWPQNYLSVMTSALQQATDYGIAYCATTQIFHDGRKVNSWRKANCVSGWITRELFLKSFVWCQAAILRKSIMSGFYWDESLKTSSDRDSFLRLSQKTKFLFVSEVEVIRRMRKDSITGDKFSPNIGCDTIRLLERFYRTNGQEYLSEKQATQRISRKYRSAAERYHHLGARKAPIYLFKQALSYDSFNIKAYNGLIKTLLRSRNRDTMPEWRMPPQLSDEIMNC